VAVAYKATHYCRGKATVLSALAFIAATVSAASILTRVASGTTLHVGGHEGCCSHGRADPARCRLTCYGRSSGGGLAGFGIKEFGGGHIAGTGLAIISAVSAVVSHARHFPFYLYQLKIDRWLMIFSFIKEICQT